MPESADSRTPDGKRRGNRLSRQGTGRRLVAIGGVALAAGVGVGALVVTVSGGTGSPSAPKPAPVAAVSQAPARSVSRTAPVVPKPKAPPAPTLHGAAPVFTPPKSHTKEAKGGNNKAVESVPAVSAEAPVAAEPTEAPAVESTEVTAAKSTEAPAPTNAPAATAKIGATPTATASAVAPNARAATGSTPTSSSGATQLDSPPAGAAAIEVAHEFAGAFIVYETAGIDSEVRQVFGTTASAALSKSLLQRPPRLPENVKVPRAKVVNVVPGPSQGKVFTVSVSLLRVGVTSELRLEMEQRKHRGWQVTNVLG